MVLELLKLQLAGNKNAIGFASFEYIDDTVSALSVMMLSQQLKMLKLEIIKFLDRSY